MRVRPGATDQLIVDWGATGATIGVRVLDNSGATVAARVEGFVEYPAGSGVYYLDPYTFPDEEEGSYTLLYDDDAGVAAVGHIALEELTLSAAAPDDVLVPADAYATREELARILELTEPTEEQWEAMDRVLTAAAGEINSEIGVETGDSLSGWQYALAEEVNLERAVEHWKQGYAPFGMVGIGGDLLTAYTARDSWDRHAHKLAPLKTSAGWGIA